MAGAAAPAGAVGGADRAAAHRHRGARHLVRGQKMDQIAHAGDVHHRVQGSHLVEVDLPHRDAVGPGLRLGDEGVDSLGPLPDRGGQPHKAVNHRQHVRQGSGAGGCENVRGRGDARDHGDARGRARNRDGGSWS